MSKLYIIGNGFDLNHELPCSYSDFLKYVCIFHHDMFHRIGSMFGDGNPAFLWQDFENNLRHFDTNKSIIRNLRRLRDEAKLHVEKNIDLLTALENACDGLYNEISLLFQEWIRDTLINRIVLKKYKLSSLDYYISFNYTNILETSYNISNNHICYLHGNLFENRLLSPVFGHGYSEVVIKLNDNAKQVINECSVDCEKVKQIYVDLINDFRKKTEGPMDSLDCFLSYIPKDNIDSVYLLGHSLGDSDKPYFTYLSKQLCHLTPLYISCYGDNYNVMNTRAKQLFEKQESIGFDSIENLLNYNMGAKDNLTICQ